MVGMTAAVSTILIMLIVGLVFVAVIVLGETIHWLRNNRARGRR